MSYPMTFMEQFCRSIHPDLELGPACVNWFRQAVKHCAELINQSKMQTSYFWTTVKNFIFPARHTELMSQKIPIKIHPSHLTMHDCQSLLLDIVEDYVLRAPRYAAESITNAKLWQVLYSVVGIMTLVSVLVGTIATCNKFFRPKITRESTEEGVRHPNKRLHAIANRSLRMAKTELRRLRLTPIVQPEELIAADGSAVLALKVTSKYELLGSIISCSVQTNGRLFRMPDQSKQRECDLKTEPINKVLQFVGNTSKKLRLLLIFEEYENIEPIKPKDKSPTFLSNSMQLPSKRKRCTVTMKNSRIEILKRSPPITNITTRSPRLGDVTNSKAREVVGDLASPRQVRCIKAKACSGTTESPKPDVSKKQTLGSPRSVNPPLSGIPRSSARFSPTKKN